LRLNHEDNRALDNLKRAAELGWPETQTKRETLLVLGHLNFAAHANELLGLLDREPVNRDVALVLAVGYLASSYLDKAESLANSLVERDPADGEARFLRARVLFAKHQLENARKD